MSVYGYCRVSTGKQAESGLGLEAQKAKIMERYPTAVILVETGSAKYGAERPVLDALLAQMCCDDTLVVSKLDRIARSTIDFGRILQLAKTNGWNLVMLDLGVDTSTSVGKLVANVIAAVAEFERDIISERTSAALAAKKDRGESCGGRRSQIGAKDREWIQRKLNDGWSYMKVANELNARRVLAPSGRQWTKDAVRSAAKVVNV